MALSFPLPARLAGFYFLFFAYSAAYVAYLPLYLAGRGLDAGEIAVVLALPQLARIFAPAAWGVLADRYGARRAIVAASCAAMALCFAALPFAPGARAIGWLIALTGVFSAGALPLVEAMTLAAPGGLARYGPIRLWGSVGFIVVLIAGGAWVEAVPLATLPPALAAIALAALASAWTLPAGARHPAGRTVWIEISPGARAILGGGFCMAAAHGALYAFYTLQLQREGYGGVAIGMMWTIGVVAEIAVFAWLPALLRRQALSAILLFSFGCAVARFLVIGWLPSAMWLMIGAQILHAATFGSFHAASVAAIHRVFPEHAQGRGQALFSSVAYGAGGAAGALLAGWGWEEGGPRLAFSLAAAVALAGAYFAYRLRRAGF
ncbi:MAG TPA: MFS transporter [Burkholderiales bacterium]|nr:MFS transporter [Burkholderiales bacterium]